MASTKMSRNRKLKQKAFNELPLFEQQLIIDKKKHEINLSYIKDFEKYGKR